MSRNQPVIEIQSKDKISNQNENENENQNENQNQSQNQNQNEHERENDNENKNDNESENDLFSSDDQCLELFRSFSMPLQSTSSQIQSDNILTRLGSSLGSIHLNQGDQVDDIEDEDDSEVMTPSTLAQFSAPISICQKSSSNPSFLASSLPTSLTRTDSHDIATKELLKLTRSMQAGILSPEKFLPSSRMKQVGIGGRGRRSLHNSALKQTLFDQNPSNSSNPYFDSLSAHSNFSTHDPHPVPLIRPRPIQAWQRLKE
ncbi:hypothetical protein O181_106156 [Austropuccinia psidii MF-1]|uniref:Uncharacterized protein n=1 Tax=Austropuccinia psidii MF-1 TaxID=1389203 RepID=A0A9Q3JQW8_9BASI|nr:hypothetical protein [Austropuccinia psidii MF-1]